MKLFAREPVANICESFRLEIDTREGGEIAQLSWSSPWVVDASIPGLRVLAALLTAAADEMQRRETNHA